MKQLYTPWGEMLDSNQVLPEYPRPQLRRQSYFNLNGYWNYAISEKEDVDGYDGKILVPFSPESVLSGVKRFVRPTEYLHYQREVTLPEDFVLDRVILHFGAVDQIAEVWINGRYVGKHVGGYTPFSFDITDFLDGPCFDIKVRVKDFSNTSYHQTGKQRIERGGIWYTPQSGIWQTVWLESVPEAHIKRLKLTPLFDEQAIRFEIEHTGHETFNVQVRFNGKVQGEIITKDSSFIVPLAECYPWSPDAPHLYDIDIKYGEDHVESYIGLRKVEKKKDASGIYRFYLNNQPLFLTGVLDQGYYPDGLLTPPSDEAMIYDIMTMKEMGFNLLRKHVKIEPARWYYHCDRLGMLVWQDMVNGSERKDIVFHGLLAHLGIHLKDHRYRLFGRQHPEGRQQFYIELKEMVDHLYSHPSIVTWVPFNEAWGQFDSQKVVDYLLTLDRSRLIDHASGWSDQGIGDYHSRHIYFTPIRFRKKWGKKRILALTEFGGYSLAVEGHRYNEDSVFGYRVYKTIEELEIAFTKLYHRIFQQLANGLSVIIYTQLSDVEDEVNGLITYDRKVVKIDPKRVNDLNQRLIERFNALVFQTHVAD